MSGGWFIDAVIGGFLIFQTFLGWRRGFLWQVAGVASIFFGVLLGLALAPGLGEHLAMHVTSNVLHARISAFIFVLGAVGFVVRIAAALAEVSAEKGLPMKERELKRADDRILGGIFGAIKGSVIALVAVAALTAVYPHSPAWDESRLVRPLSAAGSRLLPGQTVENARQWAFESVVKVSIEAKAK